MSTEKKKAKTNKANKAAEKALRKEQKKQKQEVKTEKSQKKKEAKELDGEEEITKTVARIEKSKIKIATGTSTLVACEHPGPRSNFSFCQSPLTDELIMFGGQYYDGQTQHVYGETYRWNFHKNEWRMVEAAPSPNPRSCHQAVVHKHHMYVFGGEYSTIRQFYHFRDLWRFDLKTNSWEEIKASGPSPSPRSGHRMIVWKHFIVVFGGFHDTFRDCKYFNDLYLFNIPEERWEKIDISTISVPSPRSGCGFFLHPTQDLAFIYGGYVRDKKVSGTELTDMWQLSLRLQPGMAVPVKAVWERLSKKGTAPSQRSGASFAVHKSRALVFGGVYDKDSQGLTMESEFFNELFAFDMDRKRWYVLDYNLPKGAGGSGAKERRASRRKERAAQAEKDEKEEEENDDKNAENGLGQFQWIFEYIDEHGNEAQIVVDDDPMNAENKSPEVLVENEITRDEVANDVPILTPVKESKPEANMIETPDLKEPLGIELPPERMGASMFVVGNTLVVFGGISEVKDKEITFDDCWTLDLNARDKWTNKIRGTMDQQVWLGEDESEDDEDEFEDCSDFDSDDSEGSESGSGSESYDSEVEEVKVKEKKPKASSLKEKMDRIRADHDLTETYTPLVGEALKDFFARTQTYWSGKVVEDAIENIETTAEYARVDINDKKEIRRLAFALAGERFEATSAILAKLKEYEEEQAELEVSAQKGKKKTK
jgi:N-acetylneuraminic acid mutarotase